MPMTLRLLGILVLLGAFACTEAEPKIEEPIKPSPDEPPMYDEPPGAMDNVAPEVPPPGMDDMDGDMGVEGDAAGGDAASAPAENMEAPTPPPTGNGGIISSGAKPTREQCNKLESATERRDCLKKLKKGK